MQPWHLLALSLASWLNREQHQVIEYLQAKNRFLRDKFIKKKFCSLSNNGDTWP
ncbi:MAG: hypothetical protein R3C11_01235 [Planctomycetaceae bacterium]